MASHDWASSLDGGPADAPAGARTWHICLGVLGWRAHEGLKKTDMCVDAGVGLNDETAQAIPVDAGYGDAAPEESSRPQWGRQLRAWRS